MLCSAAIGSAILTALWSFQSQQFRGVSPLLVASYCVQVLSSASCRCVLLTWRIMTHVHGQNNDLDIAVRVQFGDDSVTVYVSTITIIRHHSAVTVSVSGQL